MLAAGGDCEDLHGGIDLGGHQGGGEGSGAQLSTAPLAWKRKRGTGNEAGSVWQLSSAKLQSKSRQRCIGRLCAVVCVSLAELMRQPRPTTP